MISISQKNPEKWRKVILHLDADAFYVGCEYVKNPTLRGKPVAVLSLHDACVVSKSYEAKKYGIKTGVSKWEALRLCPQLELISADFTFYEQISNKLFEVMRTFTSEVEVYSVDEGFMDLTYSHDLLLMPMEEIGRLIKLKIKSEIGITVSLGISTTKTLAKLASETSKPDGLRILPEEEVETFIKGIPLQEIWGIGRKRSKSMINYGLRTVEDFYFASRIFLRKKFHKPTEDTWYELHSKEVYRVEKDPKIPKSIGRTSSISLLFETEEYERSKRIKTSLVTSVTYEKSKLWALLTYHMFKVSLNMAAKGLACRKVFFYAGTKKGEGFNKSIRLFRYTNNFSELIKIVKDEFDKSFIEDIPYHKCGFYAFEIIRFEDKNTDFFGETASDIKANAAQSAIRKINKKYGSNLIFPGSTMDVPRRKTKSGRVENDTLVCS